MASQRSIVLARANRTRPLQDDFWYDILAAWHITVGMWVMRRLDSR